MPEPATAGAAAGGPAPYSPLAQGPGMAGSMRDVAFWQALVATQGEVATDGLLVVAPDGWPPIWNRRFETLWNIPETAIVAQPATAIFDALAARVADAAAFRAGVERRLRDPLLDDQEEIVLTSGRILLQISRPVVGQEGIGYARLWAYREVTQDKRLENAHGQLLLEQAAREAAAQRSARLRALHEAALTMHAVMEAEPGSIAALLVEIMRRAVGALDGRDGRIVLKEDAAWRDLTPAHGPAEGSILLDHTAHLHREPIRPGGATDHVLRTGELVQVSDTLLAEGFGPYPQLARHGIRALVIVPMRIAGRMIGAFSVTFVRPRDLQSGDLEAVELFAGHAAAALERARLLYAERRRAQHAERLAATLAHVVTSPDLVTALEALLRGAMTLLGGTNGAARLFGPAPGERLLELNIESDERLITRVNPPAMQPDTYAARLQAGGPSVLVQDFRAIDPATYSGYEMMKTLGMRSAVIVPIDASSGRIGSLAVHHHLPGYFGGADLALAEALAAQAGAVIERARLDAERQAAVRTREEALDELARQTEELARREAEADALRKLDRMKDELLSTISHELRTPLTVVHGYAQHLLAGATQFGPGAVERIATLMFANSRQLVRLVQDLADFARLGGGEMLVQPEVYDLVPHLEELVTAFGQQPGGERIVTALPPTLPVYADGVRVEQIVSNLLDNALKYAPEGPVTLRAGATPASAGIVWLEVVDTGPGIPSDEQQRVWEKLYRGSGVAGLNVARGFGIGLAVVKALVEAQGGRVGLESAPGQGARFWVELPAMAPDAIAAAEA